MNRSHRRPDRRHQLSKSRQATTTRNGSPFKHIEYPRRCAADACVSLQLECTFKEDSSNKQNSVYSAYEHSLIPVSPSQLPTTTGSSNVILAALNPKIDLPLDIVLETLVSTLLLCVGVVLGSAELRPIQWREWAGKLEREKQDMVKSGDGGLIGNPYKALDDRPGFLDIRGKRKEFAAWVREGGAVVPSK